MTSHHESCKPGAEERICQLKLCFKTMVDAPQNRIVLFGGDLNMRDDEVSAHVMNIGKIFFKTTPPID
jgi:hypothetical protein